MKAVVRIDEKRDTTLTNKARSFELLFIWASTFLAVQFTLSLLAVALSH